MSSKSENRLFVVDLSYEVVLYCKNRIHKGVRKKSDEKTEENKIIIIITIIKKNRVIFSVNKF